MAFIKFAITALAATIVFTTSVLANPVPAATDVVITFPGFTLPFTTIGPITVSGPRPTDIPTITSVNHLVKRVCNEYGCGMKCKGTANTPCAKKLNSHADCEICSYFHYNADGSAVRLWDVQCLHIQWGNLPPLDKC
ncbi:hypothetical protein VE03_01852 [Pseudogymnoascus sp. 23342-1-I1]|nr:hypothetical protein VE03_01852 [Pseudogymnoascus sp. 23342-1-I1]